MQRDNAIPNSNSNSEQPKIWEFHIPQETINSASLKPVG